MSLRTPLGRVRGLGAAGEGTRHWWAQRVTAIALVPLSLWFVAGLLAVAGADHATVVAWLRSPITATLLLLLVFALFYHAQLGMRVVIEDYVHGPCVKVASLLLIDFLAVLLGLACVIAVLRVALGS